ncbi:MAG: hypothetical protein NBV67_12575, partial [Tagaea sp.]|nr:hypothetical protein [Tagaea sp.]
STGFVRQRFKVLPGGQPQASSAVALAGDVDLLEPEADVEAELGLAEAAATAPEAETDKQPIGFAIEAVATAIGAAMEAQSPAKGVGKAEKIREARMKGYTGDACETCGSMAMVRNGTCTKCVDCGSTSGCS